MQRKDLARRLRLLQVSPRVQQRIDQLLAQGPFNLPVDPAGHTCTATHPQCINEDLRHCWTSPTQPLEALKSRLWDELGYFPCPYCGISEADEFDHYLPKSAYPEFSVTAANLIPSCGRCNGLKGSHVPTNAQRILHPAIDPLSQPLLRCDIYVASDGTPYARFSIDQAVAAALGVLDPLRFHFERLQLEERFRRTTAPRLSEFLAQLDETNVGRGAEGAKVARSLAASDGGAAEPNRWSVLLYLAIARWLDP